MRLALLIVTALIAGTAMAETASPVGSWLVEDIQGGGVIDNLQTTLEIAPSGSISGNGGCNRYGGHVEINGATIKFVEVMSTQIGCPPAIMDQENTFHRALTEVKNWRLNPTGHLVLMNADGDPLVRLIGN